MIANLSPASPEEENHL